MFSREAHLRQHVSQKGITLSCDLLSKKVSSKHFPASSRTLDEFSVRANSFHGNDHNLPMCCICRQWMFTSFIVCSGSCGQQKQLFYCCAHFDKACCSCSMESRILVHRMPLSLLYALNVTSPLPPSSSLNPKPSLLPPCAPNSAPLVLLPKAINLYVSSSRSVSLFQVIVAGEQDARVINPHHYYITS
jgi:hypothetical protein